MKKIIASILCAAVTLFLTACDGSKNTVSENITDNGIEYVLADEKDFEYGDFYASANPYGVEITKYSGNGGNIIIPKELGGKQVRSIGENAFSSDSNITGVYIPGGVVYIYSTFNACPNLVNAVIPNSAHFIVDNAFRDCNKNLCVRYQSTSYTKDNIEELYTKING